MKLEEQIFNIVDSEGKKMDISKDITANVLFNGKETGLALSEIFKKITELNKGEICGNSLVQYYKIGDDGLLHDLEGNTIGLSCDRGLILLKSMEEPVSTYGAVNVSFDYVKNFASGFNIKKAEELFIDLSQAEKDILVQEREALEKSASEAAKIAKDKADAELLEKEETAKKEKEATDAAQAEADKKKKEADDAITLANQKETDRLNAIREFNDNRKKVIPKNLIVEETEFQSLVDHYKTIGFKQYEKDGFIFFYGKVAEDAEDVNEPFLLIKRNDWYEEPEEGELVVETDKNVEWSFSDADKPSKISLDLGTDDISVILGQEPV